MALPAASQDKPGPPFFHGSPRTDRDQLKAVVKVIKEDPKSRDQVLGYVYATKEARDGYVKIGYSTEKTATRPLALRKCGREYTQVYYTREFPWAYKCEQILHKLLIKHCHLLFDCGCAKVHAHYEWYRLDFLEVVSSINVIMNWMLRDPYETITETPFKAQLKREWLERARTFVASQNTPDPQGWEQFFENPVARQFDISPWRPKPSLVSTFRHCSPIFVGSHTTSEISRAIRQDTPPNENNYKSASFSGPIPTESRTPFSTLDPPQSTNEAPDLGRTRSAPAAVRSIDWDTYTAPEDDESDQEVNSPMQLKASRRNKALSTSPGREVTLNRPSLLSPSRTYRVRDLQSGRPRRSIDVSMANDDLDTAPETSDTVKRDSETEDISPVEVRKKLQTESINDESSKASVSGQNLTIGDHLDEQEAKHIGFQSDSEEDEDGAANSKEAVFFSAPSSPISPRLTYEQLADVRILPPDAATQPSDLNADALAENMGTLAFDNDNHRSRESEILPPRSRKEVTSRRKSSGSPVALTPPGPKSRTRSRSNLKAQTSKDEVSSEIVERPDGLSPSPAPHSRRSSLRSFKNLSPQ